MGGWEKERMGVIHGSQHNRKRRVAYMCCRCHRFEAVHSCTINVRRLAQLSCLCCCFLALQTMQQQVIGAAYWAEVLTQQDALLKEWFVQVSLMLQADRQADSALSDMNCREMLRLWRRHNTDKQLRAMLATTARAEPRSSCANCPQTPLCVAE